jgi:hypothetical protein
MGERKRGDFELVSKTTRTGGIKLKISIKLNPPKKDIHDLHLFG